MLAEPVILLMGSSLVEQLYRRRSAERCCEATRAQIELADEISQQLLSQKSQMNDLDEAARRGLDHNPEWVESSRDRLAGA